MPRPPRLTLGTAYLLRWEDSNCARGWRTDDELPGLDGTGCVSVGWVVRLTPRSVTLAPHVGGGGGDCPRQTNGHMVIPVGAIREARPLRLPAVGRLGA